MYYHHHHYYYYYYHHHHYYYYYYSYYDDDDDDDYDYDYDFYVVSSSLPENTNESFRPREVGRAHQWDAYLPYPKRFLLGLSGTGTTAESDLNPTFWGSGRPTQGVLRAQSRLVCSRS